MQPSLDSRDEFVSDATLAKRLNLSQATLQKWRLNGTGPRFLKLGRAVRYRVSDVEAWLASQTIGDAA